LDRISFEIKKGEAMGFLGPIFFVYEKTKYLFIRLFYVFLASRLYCSNS
jgi:hypothetical protein